MHLGSVVVHRVGIEPTSPVLQTGAITRSAADAKKKKESIGVGIELEWTESTEDHGPSVSEEREAQCTNVSCSSDGRYHQVSCRCEWYRVGVSIPLRLGENQAS